MRKILKTLIILMVSLLVMVACNNDDTTTEDNKESTNESTEEIDQTENDENLNEDSESEETEDSPEIGGDKEAPVLELGETGVIEDTLGTYEITATGFSFETEMTEEDPYQTPDNGTFIVIDVSIKNTGGDTLEANSITNTDLFTESGAGITNYTSFNSINNFDGEVSPEDIVEGQLLFDLSEEDYYELVFGYGMPDHISNEVRWALHAEDAE